MIIAAREDEGEYPVGCRFRVSEWTREKQMKKIWVLNSNMYMSLNLMRIVSGQILMILAGTSDMKSAFGILFAVIYCIGVVMNMKHSIEFLQESLLLLSIDSRLPNRFLRSQSMLFSVGFLMSILNLTPLLAIKHGRLMKKLANFPHSEKIINSNCIYFKSHSHYLEQSQVFQMCQVFFIIYIHQALTEYHPSDIRLTFEYIYSGFLCFQNTLFVQVELIISFILQSDILIERRPFILRPKQFMRLPSSSSVVPIVSDETPQIENFRKRCQSTITSLLTYIENLNQTVQTTLLFILYSNSPVMVTVFAIFWCVCFLVSCYLNGMEIFQWKSYELNILKIFFLGYRIDYVHSVLSLNFKQLRLLHSDTNFLKISLLGFFKTLITIFSIYFAQQKQLLLLVISCCTIFLDIIGIIVKLPRYNQIFIEAHEKTTPFAVQVRALNMQRFSISHSISPFSQIINVIISEPLIEEKTSLLQEILSEVASTKKTVYFELAEQLRIYSKFGHCEVYLIRPSKFLYQWVITMLSQQVKTIRIRAYAAHHDKAQLIKIAKDQLVGISFDPKNRFAFTAQEIIDNLPDSYFPKKALEEASKFYSREKVFSQFIFFNNFIYPSLLNSPQQILYDLLEQ